MMGIYLLHFAAIMAQNSSLVVIRFVSTECSSATELMQKAFKVQIVHMIDFVCFTDVCKFKKKLYVTHTIRHWFPTWW